jgi:hypothetical protein
VITNKINVFDATVVPHACLLLFAGNEIHVKKMSTGKDNLQSKNKKKRKERRAVRVQICNWIEMELSELHLAFYRRIQHEFEMIMRLRVEGRYDEQVMAEKQKLVAQAVSILIGKGDSDEVTEDDD